jgi:hypothetical protein
MQICETIFYINKNQNMAYNRKNFLIKVIEVQESYTSKKTDYNTLVGIYREFIEPKYCISLGTLYNYLAIPAKAELKKLNNSN